MNWIVPTCLESDSGRRINLLVLDAENIEKIVLYLHRTVIYYINVLFFSHCMKLILFWVKAAKVENGANNSL